jgi:hypothetical protein
MSKLYSELAGAIAWYKRVKDDATRKEFAAHALDKIQYCLELLPMGSGIVSNEIVLEKCNATRLVIFGEYHHMDENGYYAGYFGYNVTVTADLEHDFNLSVKIVYNDTDESKRYITDSYADYLSDTYCYALESEIEKWRIEK